MSTYFSVDDVFRMGIDIECNGQDFYHCAAAKATDPRTKALFNELIKQEKKHEALFERLLAHLPVLPVHTSDFGPHGESDMYLKALADTHVFNASADDIERMVAKCKTVEDVIDLAVRFEKESILFFLWVKDHTRPEWGRDKIDQLIQEEQGHIVRLAHIRQSHGASSL
jgi:rubrerythrin